MTATSVRSSGGRSVQAVLDSSCPVGGALDPRVSVFHLWELVVAAGETHCSFGFRDDAMVCMCVCACVFMYGVHCAQIPPDLIV